MGCGASTGDGVGPRRRGWARARALGPSEASTTGLLAQGQQGQEAEPSSASAGRRRGSSKVAPDPKGQHEEGSPSAALRPAPGSPSFRYYCQKTAAVDKIVADADNSDCSVIIDRSGASFNLTRAQLCPSFVARCLSCIGADTCWIILLLLCSDDAPGEQ